MKRSASGLPPRVSTGWSGRRALLKETSRLSRDPGDGLRSKNPFATGSAPDTVAAPMLDPVTSSPEPLGRSDPADGDRIPLREPPAEDGFCVSAMMTTRVTSREALEHRLLTYARETLAREEWPAVLRAWQLAKVGHMRDLVAFDRDWAATARRLGFAEASRAAGRRQLNRLQGLRHERRISRYRAAIEDGRADGWHPLVFGVFLAVYHLPIRQGLIQYGMRSLGLLADAADGTRCIHENPRAVALDRAASILPLLLPPLEAPGMSRRPARQQSPLPAPSPA